MDNIELNLPEKQIIITEAGFIKRSLAFMLDLVLLHLFIITPLQGVMASAVPQGSDGLLSMIGQSFPASFYALSTFIVIMVFIYFTLTEYITGKSAGKRLIGIELQSMDGNLKLSQVIIRNIMVLPLFPFILMWLIDPLFMMFSKDQSRLSDRIAKTRVIQRL